MENNLGHIHTEGNFVNKTHRAQVLRSIINTTEKASVRQRTLSIRQRTCYRLGKVFTNSTFSRGIISKIDEELEKLGVKTK